MFAGAAREAVFSNPDVIRRVNADFVPVALKAGLMNNPTADKEGRLYREIGRSKVAPQGICVVNSAGKVLAWAMMFDDDKSVLAFFDHAKDRFSTYPDAKKPVAAEVYQKFPSQKRKDVADSGNVLPILDRHPEGKHCPAEPPLRKGTVSVRLFGRALDKDGTPVADSIRQENYIEDRFNIAVPTQEKLSRALAEAGRGPVNLPLEVTRQWVKQAYMGMLDVQPLDNPGRGNGDLKKCEFGATKVGSGKGPTLWRVAGESEVYIDERMANGGPGDMHEVKLKWHGFIEMDGDRMTRLVLSAGGKEKLKFQSARGKEENQVASLPGGRRIDMACGVRYGILGEPAGPDKVSDNAPPDKGSLFDEERKQLVEVLRGPFIVFHEKVQEELKLVDAQKQKLQDNLPEYGQETMKFFEKHQDAKPQEREKALHDHRRKSEEKLSALLKEVLNGKQQKRLFQLQLQQAGAFALMGENEAFVKLEITDEQRKQFMVILQEMHQKIEPLMKEAQNGGNPQAIGPKIMKLRKEQEDRIDALLSDAQKKHWQEMLGKPLDLSD